MKKLRSKKRRSIKNLKSRPTTQLKRIDQIIYQIGLKRGKSSAKKVSQVLKLWQEKGLILCYDQTREWGYDDYIQHVDAWFMTKNGERVDFQIKSSQRAAQEHLEKYPDVKVIVVNPGISLSELNKQMIKLFKDKLQE